MAFQRIYFRVYRAFKIKKAPILYFLVRDFLTSNYRPGFDE